MPLFMHQMKLIRQREGLCRSERAISPAWGDAPGNGHLVSGRADRPFRSASQQINTRARNVSTEKAS